MTVLLLSPGVDAYNRLCLLLSVPMLVELRGENDAGPCQVLLMIFSKRLGPRPPGIAPSSVAHSASLGDGMDRRRQGFVRPG